MKNLYEETMYIMKKYGISANKKLGQNFLVDENVVQTIIEKSEITKEDLVIEIGPGLGTLTSRTNRKSWESSSNRIRRKNDAHFAR